MGIIWLKVKIADTSFNKGKYKIKRTELELIWRLMRMMVLGF